MGVHARDSGAVAKCDKEFFYIQIVRVIAIIYWGSYSKLITLLLLTF